MRDMRKLRLTCCAPHLPWLGWVGLAWVAGVCLAWAVGPRARAAYEVLVDDDFESYPSHSEFEAVWIDTGNSEYLLDPGFGNPGQSVRMPSPASNYNGRYYLPLGGRIEATDQEPIVFSFDLHLDPAGSYWTNARHFCELRGYSGGAFGQGDIQNVIAIGLYNTSTDTHSPLYYQGRVWREGAASKDTWYTLDAEPTAPRRAPDWHQMKVTINSSQVIFAIDEQVAEIIPRPNQHPFDTVILGSDLTADGHQVHVDNVKVVAGQPPSMCSDPVFDVVGGGPDYLFPDQAVDQRDFGIFQACYTGPSPAPGDFNEQRCGCFDVNGDRAIDEQDFAKFVACWTGAAPGPGLFNPDCDD